jgi:pantoate--beta-alanine ligase
MTPGASVQLAATIAEVRNGVAAARRLGRSVSLVPTMGALHAGHGALIDCARRADDYVVVSIFVNPIQFDRRADYEAYAIDLRDDLAFSESRGADLVFAPAVEEMYRAPQRAFVEVAEIGDHLCGRFRPGHFRGVATVVMKLFQIVQPDRAFFGEKDAQQLAVIRRMASDLNVPVEIVPVATVREIDGLAMSSRNRRLSPEERLAAPVLFRALEAARGCIARGGGPAEAKQAALARLTALPHIRVEYLEVVDPESMAPVDAVRGPVRVAAAAFLGATRLIDNILATPETGAVALSRTIQL